MLDMWELGHFQPFFAISPSFWPLLSPSAVCVCPWHTMWHLGGLWGCWWEQKAPSGRHWAITGRHVARAHLYVEMPVSRLDMELSPSILEATSRNLVQSKADIELRSNREEKIFDQKSFLDTIQTVKFNLQNPVCKIQSAKSSL